jgi:hypothetical protein
MEIPTWVPFKSTRSAAWHADGTSMTEKSYEDIKREEAAKHTCCNGYVYYDGRCGDGPIFIHDKHCAQGKREDAEWDYWSRERR